jgi:hypothetical protein
LGSSRNSVRSQKIYSARRDSDSESVWAVMRAVHAPRNFSDYPQELEAV